MAKAILRPTREARVRSGHPWVFSSDIEKAQGEFEPGDVVNFHIYRQGEEVQLDVEIGSKTESALKNEEAAEEEAASQELPQQEIQGWSDNPFEDFFHFFGY